jgi:translation initiation factor 2 subunit 1
MTTETIQACRYYQDSLPEVGDVVYVKINRIMDHGVYCSLLEYGNTEGYITSGEISRKRIKSIRQIVKEGSFESAMVQRVNEKTNEIDLSLKAVQAEDKTKCEAKYKRGKRVNSIIRQLSDLTGVEPLELYDQIVWPIAETFGDTIAGFKQFLDGETELEDIEFPSAEVKHTLLDILKRKLKAEDVVVKAVIEVTCYTMEGIEGIKRALACGTEQDEKEPQIKIALIAAPEFSISVVAPDKEFGTSVVQSAIERITRSITVSGGNIKVNSITSEK